jgi:ABC-type antimicrobial peptide transport system permease subunit
MQDLNWPFQLRFFIALGLSFLIGLERESSGIATKGRVFDRCAHLLAYRGIWVRLWLAASIIMVLGNTLGLISLAGLALAGIWQNSKNEFCRLDQ